MKEQYENAEMEVVEFSAEDTVSTSGVTSPTFITAETGEYELGGDPWAGGQGSMWG